MKHMRLLLFMIVPMLLFQACKKSTQNETRFSKELMIVADLMTGSFSSQEQAEQDSNFYDIRLEMVRIWNDQKDAVYLYVEQAVATSLDRPYRQRVYRLTEDAENTFRSEVYTLPGDPLTFAGSAADPDLLGNLSPDHLALRDGCDLVFHKNANDSYEGSTNGKECVSTIRGASYATSEIRMDPAQLYSWDRGWDENDEQVWGAETSGYLFKKMKNYSTE